MGGAQREFWLREYPRRELAVGRASRRFHAFLICLGNQLGNSPDGVFLEC